MKTSRLFAILTSTALLFSCSLNEIDNNLSEGGSASGEQTTLYASFDDTKTALQEDWSVFWETGDELAVIGNSDVHSFTADQGGAAVSAFTGDLAEDQPLYAVYPKQSYTERDGNKLNIEIPNLQYGLKNGFDSNAAVCVGKIDGDCVTLSHIVALVRFTLTTDDIASVSISNAAGAKIAGSVSVTMPDSGAPVVSGATSDHVLILPDGDTFEAGTYYAALAPSALTGGIQFAFTRSSDNRIASKVGTNPVLFEQETIMNFGIIDSGLSWQEMTRVVLNFASVDGDGNLIYEDGKFSWSNPFSSPESFSSSYKSGTFKDQDAILKAKDEYGGFNFPVHSKNGFYQNATSCFRWGRGAGSYITIPQIPGLTLAAVRTVFTKAGVYNGMPCIGDETACLNGGDPYNVKFKSAVNVIWHVLGADPAKTYRIKTASDSTGEDGECEMARLEFFYTGEVTQKVLNLTCSAAVKSATTAQFSADFCSLSIPLTYTCGFEYKKVSDALWTSVDAAPAMSFSYEFNSLEEDCVYNVRSWVDAGEGKIYSETAILSTATTKVTFDFTTSGAPFLFPDPEAITTDATMKDSFISPMILKGGENYCCTLNYFRSGTRKYNEEWGVKWIPDQYLLFATSKDSYFSSPAINGLTLTKVEFTFNSKNTTGSANAGIYDSSNNVLSNLAVNSQSADPENPVMTLTPDSPLKEGESYRVLLSKGESKKDRQSVISITFCYSGTATQTVQYVSNPTISAGTVSSSVYVNSVTSLSDITSGFEYKAGGAGSFTALASGTLSSMTDGVTTASASVSLSEGDIVRAWASIDGGATKVYGPETAI